MWLRNQFPIAENPWWTVTHYEAESVDKIVRDATNQRRIVAEQYDNDYFWQGYAMEHHKTYLLECINGECSKSQIGLQDVDRMLAEEQLVELVDNNNDQVITSRLVTKLRNMHTAATTLFPNIFLFKPPNMDQFNMKFVKNLHTHVGEEGLIEDAGYFRTKDAQPAQEYFWYVTPRLIEEKLEKLLTECRQIFSNADLTLEDAVKYGACFLETFLFIHPFSNGNGRVGRLLLSYLLTNFTIVPLSLYSSDSTRNVYLQCLREARKTNTEYQKPASLSRFILENIQRTFERLFYCLELELEYNTD